MDPLFSVALRIVVWVSAMLLVAGVTIIGPRQLYGVAENLVRYLRESRRQVAALLVVLAASAVARQPLQAVSEVVGLQLTGFIFAIEGEFVAWVQTFATPELTLYFSWVYVYGYVFLLVFPFMAYAALPTATMLKRLMAAYTLNYAIGLLIYTLVFAHGPRNMMPDLVSSLLYTFNPDVQSLTGEINEATNVFPSLHTSLSVTAAVFAVLSHDRYRAWTPIAVVLAGSVVVSTMYLGIHWLTDVVAGIGLAVGSVYLSYRIVEDGSSGGESDAEVGKAMRGDSDAEVGEGVESDRDRPNTT